MKLNRTYKIVLLISLKSARELWSVVPTVSKELTKAGTMLTNKNKREENPPNSNRDRRVTCAG